MEKKLKTMEGNYEIGREMICKCGNRWFHADSNKKLFMCSMCHSMYDDKGNERTINKESYKGNIVYLKSVV